MLDYEWVNPSSVMLDGSDSVNNGASDPNNRQLLHHHNTILDNYNTTQAAFNNLLPPQPHQHHHHHHSLFPHHFNQQAPPQQFHSSHFVDPGSVYSGASSYAPPHHHHFMLNMDSTTIQGHHQGLMMIPKREDLCPPTDFVSRIGLNLGGRTYFSSEDDFMSRLYRRSRPGEHGALNSPRCQAEGCHADLSQSKHYHRRHKVCEFHSKAPTVIANGLTQRFCQQCSRFHLLGEFDNGKRSCRNRLADHNRRRRKTQQPTPSQDNQPSQHRSETSRNSPSDNVTQSPGESAGRSSSAVTVAVSPPRMGLDCFRQRQYHQAPTSSGSSSSLFFSSG